MGILCLLQFLCATVWCKIHFIENSPFSFSLIFCVYFLRSKSKSIHQLFSVHQFVVNLITKTNFLKAFQLYVINPN